MATDTKISSLTALTGANTASGDLIPIVDVSDTTQASTGTTKSITRDELRSAMGVPREYVALIEQSGTAAPTATILRNTLGGVPVWGRTDVGQYTLTLAGAFAGNLSVGHGNGQAAVLMDAPMSGPPSAIARYYNIERATDNVINLVMVDGTFGFADFPFNTSIEIHVRIYP
jgi:hypothetical protein